MARTRVPVVLALLTTFAVTPPAGASPSCFGSVATIVGTQGRDHLVGTPGPDVIVGLGGRDSIVGGRGRDLICAGDGDGRISDRHFQVDRVKGGPGDDRIDGGAGPNDLSGGPGNDLITGGTGLDFLDGGRGRDSLRGGRSEDVVYGRSGDDTLFLGPGGDVGRAGGGDDEVHGGAGEDSLGSVDAFSCEDGEAPRCAAGGLTDAGSDLLRGGPGDDMIAFGRGNDVMHGGPGRDEAAFSSYDETSSFVADLRAGEASGAGNDELRKIEDLSAYSSGTITLLGDAKPNELVGGAAHESSGIAEFVGRHGDDSIELWPPPNRGPAGNLTVRAGAGNDRIDLAACSSHAGVLPAVAHHVVAGTGDDAVSGSCVDDDIRGGEGDDELVGEEGIDTVDGGPGTDTCEGEVVTNCEP